MSTKEISLQELFPHRSSKDAWVAVQGKVYDVSKYLDEHPGGEEILLDVAGQDATVAFQDAGHSDDARETMESFYIGDLECYEAPTAKFVFAAKQSLKTIENKIPSNSNLRTTVSKLGAVLGVLGTAGTVAWSKLSDRISFLPAPGWKLPAATGYVQLVSTLTAAISISALAVAAIKFKKTLDLDYEVEHHKPHFKSKRLFYRPPQVRSRPPALDAKEYRLLQLTERQKLSHNVQKFRFALPHPSDSLELPLGRHVVLQAEIDGKTISRSYTPTSRNEQLGHMDLIIKVYPNGAMGNYLSDLPLQQSIKVRGPAGRFKYNRFLCDRIGCIAGGSGITPMLQVIRGICEDPVDNTIVSLIYANQTEDDILVRDELSHYATQYPGQFSVRFFLDKPPAAWDGGAGFVTADAVRTYLPPVEDGTKFLVCGPPPMVNSMKGILVSLGCAAPGPVSKTSDQVYLF